LWIKDISHLFSLLLSLSLSPHFFTTTDRETERDDDDDDDDDGFFFFVFFFVFFFFFFFFFEDDDEKTWLFNNKNTKKILLFGVSRTTNNKQFCGKNALHMADSPGTTREFGRRFSHRHQFHRHRV
jgi:hypothetical protein